jgi:hypothetical protein
MTGDELVDFAEAIKSKDDFIKFMGYYLEDFHANIDEWDNQDLASYLAGLNGFLVNMDGYYKNKGESVDVNNPSWRMLAEALLAACVLEG